MAFATDQIKTDQTDPFICSMCKIRGKTEEAIKNHILQVHLSEHFAEVDTTAGIQDSLSQIFKECSNQKIMQNGDQTRRIVNIDYTSPGIPVLNGSAQTESFNTNLSPINSIVSSSISNVQVSPMASLSFPTTPPKISFQNGHIDKGLNTNFPQSEYITMKDQNGQPLTIHNGKNISTQVVPDHVTYSVPVANINGAVEAQQPYHQLIHTDTSNGGTQNVGKTESEQPHTNGITVNYGGGGADNAQQMLQQQSLPFQPENFPGSSSDTSNDFVCAKCTYRTDKIDQLENHLKDAHPASCVSFLCKHCNFKASNSRLFNIHLSVAHGNSTESMPEFPSTEYRSVVYKGAVATTTNSSSKGNIQITTSTLGSNGTTNCIASEPMDVNNSFTQSTTTPIQEPFQVNGTPEEKSRERLKCEICETAFFQNAEALQEHKDQYHLGMRYQCFRCSASFSEGPELQVHYLTKHNISSNEYKVSQVDAVRVKFVVDETNKKFSCDLCGMRFTTCSAMYKHKRAKHLGMEYKCHLCNYTNGYRRGLKSHYETKHKNEPYNIPRTTKGALLKKPDRKSNDTNMENCTAIISPAAESPEMATKNRQIINASPATTPANTNTSPSPIAFNIPQNMEANTQSISLPTVPLTIHNSSDNINTNPSITFATSQNTITQPSQQISILNGGNIKQAIPPLINGNSFQEGNQTNIQTPVSGNKIMIIRQAPPNTARPTVIPMSSSNVPTITPTQNHVALISQPISNGHLTVQQSSPVKQIPNSVAPSISSSPSMIISPAYQPQQSPVNCNAKQTYIPTVTTTAANATATPPTTAYIANGNASQTLNNSIQYVTNLTAKNQVIAVTTAQTHNIVNGATSYCLQGTNEAMVASLQPQSIMTPYQQDTIHSTIPVSTNSTSISNTLHFPSEPLALPEAISEVVTDDVVHIMNDEHNDGYGLQSLDNLKPNNPAILPLSSNIANGKSEESATPDMEVESTSLKPRKMPPTSKETLGSEVDWNQALAIINGIPDTPNAVKPLEMKPELGKTTNIPQEDPKINNISDTDFGKKCSEFSGVNGASEPSKTNRLIGETYDFSTSNSIVKMKESHNRFRAFIKKGRHPL